MAQEQRVAVVTDSTSDIPTDIAHDMGITVVPAILTIEGQSFNDGEGITREEIYHRMPTLREPLTTAVPSSFQFTQVYQRLLSQGYEKILSIHLSSKLSGMLNAAKQAANQFADSVVLFDSQQLSLGLGFQAIEAAKAARAGGTLEEIMNLLEGVRERIRVVAMINSLEYLRRSGRVSWLRAGMGDLLRIKLLVEIRDGLVEELGKTRTRSRAVDEILSLAKQWTPLERLAVLHAGIPAEARQLASDLQQLLSQKILVVDVTTVIGAHVGPGSFGLAALRQ